MKSYLVVPAAVICSAFFSFAAIADDTKPVVQDAQSSQATPNAEEFDKQLTKIQENMKLMHEQMEKIQGTTNTEERRKLLGEHWKVMQDSMGMMPDMWTAGGMGGCMGGGGMMDHDMMQGGMMHGMGNNAGGMKGWHNMQGYYSKLTPEQMQQHQYMMDQYMGTQMMMMDQMMQHQHWMGMMQSQKK